MTAPVPERVEVHWHGVATSGGYRVFHYTGAPCPHCKATGVAVRLLEPMPCGACLGTGEELRAGCFCERCVAAREALPRPETARAEVQVSW